MRATHDDLDLARNALLGLRLSLTTVPNGPEAPVGDDADLRDIADHTLAWRCDVALAGGVRYLTGVPLARAAGWRAFVWGRTAALVLRDAAGDEHVIGSAEELVARAPQALIRALGEALASGAAQDVVRAAAA